MRICAHYMYPNEVVINSPASCIHYMYTCASEGSGWGRVCFGFLDTNQYIRFNTRYEDLESMFGPYAISTRCLRRWFRCISRRFNSRRRCIQAEVKVHTFNLRLAFISVAFHISQFFFSSRRLQSLLTTLVCTVVFGHHARLAPNSWYSRYIEAMRVLRPGRQRNICLFSQWRREAGSKQVYRCRRVLRTTSARLAQRQTRQTIHLPRVNHKAR
jgi:hypothetical protein